MFRNPHMMFFFKLNCFFAEQGLLHSLMQQNHGLRYCGMLWRCSGLCTTAFYAVGLRKTAAKLPQSPTCRCNAAEPAEPATCCPWFRRFLRQCGFSCQRCKTMFPGTAYRRQLCCRTVQYTVIIAAILRNCRNLSEQSSVGIMDKRNDAADQSLWFRRVHGSSASGCSGVRNFVPSGWYPAHPAAEQRLTLRSSGLRTTAFYAAAALQRGLRTTAAPLPSDFVAARRHRMPLQRTSYDGILCRRTS
jgi:hypothetical protein